MAKGMGNGFPIGGILIAPHFKASYGLLGTTLVEVIWLAQQVSLF
jgi:acetylornithine/succinyldiaminopimelate/putrescine aminotransferase